MLYNALCMAEKLAPLARRALDTRIAVVSQKAEELALSYGKIVSDGGGDSYDDEFARLIEQEKLMAQGAEYTARALLALEILTPPTQFEVVEVGHRVTVKFEGDSELGEAGVTVLTPANVMLLKDLFNQKDEIIVSDRSPLGSALLNKRVGVTLKYTPTLFAKILEISVNAEIFFD